jgi:hypothetical protein
MNNGGALEGRLIWGVAIVGGAGLLFLVLFGVWMFRNQEGHGEDRLRTWTLYGQFLFSTLLAVLICLLMIPKTISAEAGLAVLAALGGFAAGRTVTPPGRRRRRKVRTQRTAYPERRERREQREIDRPEIIPRRPVAATAVPLPPEALSGEAPPPMAIDPIVTARYPRNRGGKP